jgi:hypothetical protein
MPNEPRRGDDIVADGAYNRLELWEDYDCVSKTMVHDLLVSPSRQEIDRVGWALLLVTILVFSINYKLAIVIGL